MKMNKISIYLSLVAIIAALITSSCRDEFNQEQALANQTASDSSARVLSSDLEKRNQEDLEILRDSLRRAGVLVDYAVSVVDASTTLANNNFTRQKSVQGATVTISQLGATVTATTDASGIATFADVIPGDIAVNVTASGYTEVSFGAILDWDDSTDPLVERQEFSQIGIFDTDASTVTGRLSGDVDLTNGADEALGGVPVTAKILNAETFRWNINTRNAAYSVSSSTTTADDGTYTIGIPATVDNSFFQVELNFGDVTANRSFLRINESTELPEFVSESAIWGQDITNSTPDEDPGGTGAPLSNVLIQTVTPAKATTAATFTVTFDDQGDTDPTNNTVVIAIATGGAGYPVSPGAFFSDGLEFNISGGGAATILRGINQGTGGAFTQNSFLNVDVSTGTQAGTGILGDGTATPTFPFDVITITGLHTSAPTVALEENYQSDAPVYYAEIDGGSLDDLNVGDNGGFFFNATSVITGFVNVIDNTPITDITVILNGNNFPFGVHRNNQLSTSNNSISDDHIISSAGTGLLDGNDLVSRNKYTGSVNSRFISNPEPGQSITLNVFYGEGAPLE